MDTAAPTQMLPSVLLITANSVNTFFFVCFVFNLMSKSHSSENVTLYMRSRVKCIKRHTV